MAVDPSPPLWRQIQKKNFTDIQALADFLKLSEENRSRVLQKSPFPLNLPLRLAQKIERNCLEDPIFKQFLPIKEEIYTTFGSIEPVEDQRFRLTPKLLQKYDHRALLICSSACAMHCRYCFRQNFPYETKIQGFAQELAILQQDTTLSEVILSGGDPLSLSTASLGQLLLSLERINHLKRIRFHTRFPIGIPERIDKPFLDLLRSSSKQILFVIHCNHPKELDPDILSALKQVQRLGIPVLNQSVLLRGVNDDVTTLAALSEALVNSGILPYYLHAHDPVQGTEHFDVPDERGASLIASLQTKLSGYAVPKFVREIPGMASKTPISNHKELRLQSSCQSLPLE
jgi:EF-P beta-lysylation protein EpmB